ncbi:hypothetical protein Lal_00007884 [Lupinus albus]|nr:hypothetical protein Lal_00007884 [Lupinus albus]
MNLYKSEDFKINSNKQKDTKLQDRAGTFSKHIHRTEVEKHCLPKILGSRQPYLPVLWKIEFPFQVTQQRFFERVPKYRLMVNKHVTSYLWQKKGEAYLYVKAGFGTSFNKHDI